MRHEPSKSFAWILLSKDNFSKFAMVYVLHSKRANEVTAGVAGFIKIFASQR
jgi:hypothetical protein